MNNSSLIALLELNEGTGVRQTINPGDVLFYEGDHPDAIIRLISGEVDLTFAGQQRGNAQQGDLLDPAASLGDLPHTVKATAAVAAEIIRYPLDVLKIIPEFESLSRNYLASLLRDTQTRLDEVIAPIHYSGVALAQVSPGPFIFKDTELVIAFCECGRGSIEAILPAGLNLLTLPGRERTPIFLGLARFPNAHPEGNPGARFAYTESSVFIPVWHENTPGVFIPYIYPSSWEPILVGREVYGFPKRPGWTDFAPGQVSLTVDGRPHLSLTWDESDASNETGLVAALMEWLGIQRHAAAAGFQLAEVLRKAVMRAPAQRRVDVFLHKRILAVSSTPESPRYAVDQLTHAVFGVLRWFQVARLLDAKLNVDGGPLARAGVTLQEAFRTTLDMRLSAGEVARDYLTS